MARAEYAYQRALERDPDAPDILNNLAVLYIQRENFDQALRILEPLVKRYPTRADLRLNIAIVLTNTGRLEMARDHVLTALRQEPGHIKLRELLDILQSPEDVE